eukprot:1157423-Pelagomonas_calceolata.AAC.6
MPGLHIGLIHWAYILRVHWAIVSPAADQPDSGAVGQPLETLVHWAHGHWAHIGCVHRVYTLEVHWTHGHRV